MRRLLIALVVLAVLAVAADRGGEELAERRVAAMLQERENLPVAPDVEFEGFPFLTQVLDRHLTRVRVSLPTAEAKAGEDRLEVRRVVATFSSVDVSSDFRRATAARMRGRAVVPYSAVNRLGPFTASYGGRSDSGVGLVTLTREGLPADLAGDVEVRVEGGVVSFVAADGTAATAVPADLRPALEAVLGRRYDLAGLPSEFTVESVHATRAGIQLALSARDVPLGG